jgi:hypothetical protein
MSSAKGEKRHGHASCALRHPNFDCGTTILRMKATSASAYRQIKWAAALTLSRALRVKHETSRSDMSKGCVNLAIC